MPPASAATGRVGGYAPQGRIVPDSDENDCAWSAADLAHRACRPDEVDLADSVSGPLRAHGTGDGFRNPIVEVDRVEAAVRAQHGAQVGLVKREQTRAELPLGREPHTVAVITERLRHARDDTNVADAVAIHEPFGRLDMIVVESTPFEWKFRVDALDDLARRHDLFLAPLPLSVERHELDEPHTDASLATEAREIDDLVIVNTAH